MKSLILIGYLILFFSCQTKENKDKKYTKRIDIEFNRNIHTSHIVETFVWPGHYPTRPMVVKAQNYFKGLEQHAAIKLSDSLLKNEIFYFDELSEILLYLEDFPSTKFKHSLDQSPYANKQIIINEWIEKLSKFYVDANVEAFLNENIEFYKGAQKEVKKNLPPVDFINHIEKYYGNEKLKYTIIPSPEMPTGGAYGYRGIGPYVYTDNGMMIYQIISASLPIKKDSITNNFNAFGFDNKEFTLRNSYHEFGHAFVNTVLSKNEYQGLIKKYKHLFTPKLKKIMTKHNYEYWFDCLAEHFVRLGEIRLAETSGNRQWAAELRKYHTQELDFIFLPKLEDKIIEYETNRTKYASWEDFLPELLRVFETVDAHYIDEMLNKNRH